MAKKKKLTQPEHYIEEPGKPVFHSVSAVESEEEMLRRIGDLLGFLDFAFPGAAEMDFDENDQTIFFVNVNNVLEESVQQLIVPKLRSPWEKEHAIYRAAQQKLRIQFQFRPEMWSRMLPVFFMPIAHGKPESITPTHVGTLLTAIADGTVDGRNYQEWITKNMTDE